MSVYERIVELDSKIVKRTFHRTLESAMKVDDNIYYHEYLELVKKGEHIPKKFIIRNRTDYFYFSHTIENKKYKKIRIIIKAIFCGITDKDNEIYCLCKTSKTRSISVPDVMEYAPLMEMILGRAQYYLIPKDWIDKIPENYKYRYLTILKFPIYE